MKAAISLKEAREAFYWLRVLESDAPDEEILVLRQEADELVAILTTTVRTARRAQIARSAIGIALLLVLLAT